MSTQNANGKESTGPDWESIGRELLDLELRVRGGRANTQLHELVEQIQNGEEPNHDTLRKAREHLDLALSLVENHLGPTDVGAIVTEFDDRLENHPCLCTEEAD